MSSCICIIELNSCFWMCHHCHVMCMPHILNAKCKSKWGIFVRMKLNGSATQFLKNEVSFNTASCNCSQDPLLILSSLLHTFKKATYERKVPNCGSTALLWLDVNQDLHRTH